MNSSPGEVRMLDVQAYPDFNSAAAATLKFLRQRLAFDLWMVTRAASEDWIILRAEDHGYGVQEGQVFRRADSLCSQMIEGRGPRMAPRAAEVPAYAAAPIGRQLTIGAYVGVPLTRGDGSLFGTLCAIHPAALPDSILAELPLVELLARLLSALLDAELTRDEQARRAEQAQADAQTDELTGLCNRRGWDQFLSAEESRCRRHGHPACVISVDIDGLKSVNDSQGHAAGDALLCTAARTLRAAIREHDFVARVGGDEFVLLLVEAQEEAVADIAARLQELLSTAQVRASIGAAARDPRHDLLAAWRAADQAMYAQKRIRQSAPRSG